MLCPTCKTEMRQTGKDTFSGREIREYECDTCGHSGWDDTGEALWSILHRANEEEKENKKS